MPAAVEVMDAAWPRPARRRSSGSRCRSAPRRSRPTAARCRRRRWRRSAELDGWLLGPHDSAAYPEEHRAQLNPSGAIRKHFDLFANIRPAKAFEGTPALLPGIDLVVVRENTEGFYADRNTYRGTGEYMPTPDVAIAMGIFTRPAIERIARQAFELARRRRKHVTVVHKANVLRMTTGFFLRDLPRDRRRSTPMSRSTTSTSTR